MTVKITEKDKALLIVLAIIIVVFAAVMLPNYGIKALFEKTSQIKADTSALNATNDATLATIISDGVPQRYAEDYLRAQEAMEENILHKKHQAIKLSNIICNFDKSLWVPYEWVDDIKYFNYQLSELNLFASINYEEQTENAENTIEIPSENPVEGEENEEVEVMLSSMRLVVSADGLNEFGMESEMIVEDVDMSSFALLLAYLAQLEQKGSILIDSYTYNPEGQSTVNISVYMPSEGDMKSYSALIGECPNCGEPYYYEDALNGDYVCSECDTPIAQQ